MKQSDINLLEKGTYRIEDNLFVFSEGRDRKKRFFFRGMFDGERFRLKIGDPRYMKLSDAKTAVARIRGQIANGIDPRIKEDKKVEAKKPVAHKFKTVALELIDVKDKSGYWTDPKAFMTWSNTIDTYANPFIGEKDVADITRDDIINILTPIWTTKHSTATKVRQRLEVILNYARLKGYRTAENVAIWNGNMSFFFAPTKKIIRIQKHHESPSLDEAKIIISTALSTKSISHLAIAFGLLTATREQEFMKARWDEIDGNVWSVPPERRKDKKPEPFRVPISSLAKQILDLVPIEGDYIFHSEGSVRHLALGTALVTIKRITGDNAVTMHGCRATFSTWCAEKGISKEIREACLCHSFETAVQEAYQHSDLLEQRREVMEKWAKALTK